MNINYIEDAIKEFTDKYSSEYYENYFKKCESQFFLNCYIDRGDIDLANSVINKISIHDKQKDVFCDELIKIYKYALLNNVDIIGLKGVFLEIDLYNGLACKRIYNDIDLLIRNKDRKKIADYFISEKNFSIYDDKNFIFPWLFKLFKSNVKRIKNINIDNINHIVLMKKTKGLKAMIELHSNFNVLKLSNFDHDNMIKEKKEIIYNNCTFYTLSDIDNLLFLSHHMIRHLPYVYQESIDPLFVDINKIIDIAIILKKFSFEKKAIIDKCIKYDIVPYVALAFYITNEIFPDDFVFEVYKDLLELAVLDNFSWKKIFLKLIKLNPIEIITGEIDRQLPNLYRTVKFIEKYIGPFEEYTKMRNVKMCLWKIALKTIS